MLFLLEKEVIKLEVLKKISEINKITPGVWLVASNIIQNIKYTLILNDTLIVSVYELTEKKLIMLYKILKELIKTSGINKIINKKEFLIVKVRDQVVVDCLINSHLWRLIDVKEIIESNFGINQVKMIDNYVLLNLEQEQYKIIVENNKYIKLVNINNGKELLFEYSYERSTFEMTILDNFRKIKSN